MKRPHLHPVPETNRTGGGNCCKPPEINSSIVSRHQMRSPEDKCSYNFNEGDGGASSRRWSQSLNAHELMWWSTDASMLNCDVLFFVLFSTNKPARYSAEEISYLNNSDKHVCPRLKLWVEEITSLELTNEKVIPSKAPYIAINSSDDVI